MKRKGEGVREWHMRHHGKLNEPPKGEHALDCDCPDCVAVRIVLSQRPVEALFDEYS